ncbi:MAG: anaerobic ribonucleoside-triphosphate reductase activating protein [Nanoarchaeota archaeon]|nr:anaerobic ribonucleoside-triphosphate reductase activating protein [Nanoarchaeota archaeon]
MPIKGFVKMSLIEYPGKTSSVIFLGGCNFRCPFCQNPDLIDDVNNIPTIPEEEVINYLKEKKKWIDGVCITGGEPTLEKNLAQFIKKIKSLGFLVKLDTNGSNPKILKELIDKKLLDFIAMDIKSSPNRYSEASGVEIDIEKIKSSANLVRNSGLEYEFRSTVLPKLFSKNDAKSVGEWLKGSKIFFLQQFRAEITLDKSYEKEFTYSKEELKELQEIMKPYFDRVEIRLNQ